VKEYFKYMSVTLHIPTPRDLIKRFSRTSAIVSEIAKSQSSEIVDPIVAMRPASYLFSGGAVRKQMVSGVTFNILRDFANFYPVARACVEYRKSLISKLDWQVAPLEINNETIGNEA
jgi:hypothetical protein